MAVKRHGDAEDEFILQYVRQHHGVDVLDGDFHDAYHQRFGGARDHYGYNAPVKKAMRRLRTLYRAGVLKRHRQAIGMVTGTGLPTWVYVYTLSESTRET